MPIPHWIRNLPKALDKKRKSKSKERSNEESESDAAATACVDNDDIGDAESGFDDLVVTVSDSEQNLLDFLAQAESRLYKPSNTPVILTELPDEILLRIVGYISPLEETFMNLRLCCHRLRIITEDLSLYHKYELRVPKDAVFSFAVLRMVLDVSRNLIRSLDLTDCADVNDYALFRLICNFSQLKKLNVSGCKQLTNAGLRVVGNYSPHLTWFDFSRCPLVTCAGVLQLFQCLGGTLSHVNMSNCLGIRKDPHKLTAISQHFKALRHLEIGWSRDLVKLNPLLDMDLDRLTKGCNELNFLDISYSHSTNTSISTITNNCPLLETLLVRQCFIQDTGLRYVGLRLQNLKVLNLSDCWYVTDTGIESIANGCQQLESIDLTRCYEIHGQIMVMLASQCQLIATMILRQCFRIDDQAVEYIGLKNPKLQHIDVSYNMNVTMDTVRRIKRRRPDLSLVAEGCPGVSPFGSKSRFRLFQCDINQIGPRGLMHGFVKETAV